MSKPPCVVCGSENSQGPAGNCPVCLLQLALPENLRAHDFQPSAFPRRFGEYEILGEIGRGGMGIVYEARQTRLGRTVALKMLAYHGKPRTPQVERFALEAEAVARLDHPHIVELYEAGDVEGQHYLTMPLLEGGTLTELLTRIDQRSLASILLKISRAIHYSHERGVLHRDLKPSNILLDKHGEPYVCDFGLAKWLDQEIGLTQTQDWLGTLNYAAPEVIQKGSSHSTVAADIYSIGAILYHGLAGEPPFKAESAGQTMVYLLNHEIPPPSALRERIDADLEAICLKSLSRLPHKRYESVADLAADLDRYLKGEPIQAKQYGFLSKCTKWVRRNPALTALILLGVCAAGLLFLIQHSHSSLLQAQRDDAVKQRGLAEQEKQKASKLSETLQMQQAEHFFEQDNAGVGIAYLARLVRDNPRNWAAAERLYSALTYRNWPLPVALFERNSALVKVRFVSNTQLLAATASGSVVIYDIRSSAASAEMLHQGVTNLFVDYRRNKLVSGGNAGRVCLWNASTGKLEWERDLGDPITQVAFNHEGDLFVVSCRSGLFQLYQTLNQQLIRESNAGGAIRALAFSPEGDGFATADIKNGIQVWGLKTGQLSAVIREDPRDVHGIEFTQDKKLWVLGFQSLRIYNEAGMLLQKVSAPGYRAHSIGTAFFAQDAKGSLWNVASAQSFASGIHHSHHIQCAEFSPGALSLITGSFDRTARLWSADLGEPISEPFRHDVAVYQSTFSPDGLHVATGSPDGVVTAWRANPAKALPLRLPHGAGEVWRVDFIDDGKKVLTASYDKTGRIWDAENGQLLLTLQHTSSVLRACITPDFRFIATAEDDQWARIWDAKSGELIRSIAHSDRLRTLEMSADGTLIATATRDGTARIWKIPDGSPVTPPLKHGGMVHGLSFSSDGLYLATASDDESARVWNCRTGEPIYPPLKHGDKVFRVLFSNDNRLIATAANDRTARIWEAASGKLLHEFAHKDVVRGIHFNRDNSRLVTSSWDHTAQVWNLQSGRAEGFPMQHKRLVHSAVFSPDGKRIASVSGDGTLRLWDATTGLPISEPLKHGEEWRRDSDQPILNGVVAAQFSSDGASIVTACYDGYARIWHHVTAGEQSPRWLCELAEALGGYYLSEDHRLQSFTRPQFLKLRNKLEQLGKADSHSEWLGWFLAPPAIRPIAPRAEVFVPALVQKAIASGKLSLLWEAGQLHPTNQQVFQKLLNTTSNSPPQSVFFGSKVAWQRHLDRLNNP